MSIYLYMITYIYALIPIHVYILLHTYTFTFLHTRTPICLDNHLAIYNLRLRIYSYKRLHPAKPIYALNMFTYSHSHILIYVFIHPHLYMPYTCSHTSRSIYLYWYTDFDAHMQPIHVYIHLPLYTRHTKLYIPIYDVIYDNQYILVQTSKPIYPIYILIYYTSIHQYIYTNF
jgi:hypothetical protein